MKLNRVVLAGLLLGGTSAFAGLEIRDDPSIAMPVPGAYRLHVITPDLLELTLITTKPSIEGRVTAWDFVDAAGGLHLPPPAALAATIGGERADIQALGFKRRVLFAPLRKRDLRIANYLYLRLGSPIAPGKDVRVSNISCPSWPGSLEFHGLMDPLRYNPAIHINQAGYIPGEPMDARVGFYLGSMGELSVPTPASFQIVDSSTGNTVYRGTLTPTPDIGFTYKPTPYQKVFEADFSNCTNRGQFKLLVEGLGTSRPFWINDGAAMAFARTYALGLYHQRCGSANELPFTRFTHEPCHTAEAEVPLPQSSFVFTWNTVADKSSDFMKNPRHTAPQLKSDATQLYPFVKRGKINVSGGHHDAGDYSKYTLNSAALIHALVFAVDAFDGVGELDNLGIPESGDGKSDLLEEAKWEADFLSKMQDADGGFYFLVYPRNREYESEVLPDHGDPQVVWPKNTAATAAATAALAQCASSPLFKRQFPEAAARYLIKARLGWRFLTNAIAVHGKDGAYQKLTHYGDEFMHDDELAWAACEMFLATGDPACHQALKNWFDPSDPATRRWGWWRMFEGYGCAARSYAFAVKSGRINPGGLDSIYLAKCRAEIARAADDHVHWSRDSAYGTSFPPATKDIREAGWYFSTEQAFDIVVASQLDSAAQLSSAARRDDLSAIIDNLNYEAGCNPVNVSYITGLGWKRQREIVHQYALNDRRVLPPSGIPLGNIQSGFQFMDPYGSELGAMTFPLDGALTAPYPFYDRWGDSFNVMTEFVAVNQAHSLAVTAFLAAQTPLRTNAWRSAVAQITGLPAQASLGATLTAGVRVPGLDLSGAVIVWEARDQEPAFGDSYKIISVNHGAQWAEVEVQWPDGRRAFAATNFVAANHLPNVSVVAVRAIATGPEGTPGVFTFTRTGNTFAPLTVRFNFSGTATKWNDYRRAEGDMPEAVTIPTGAVSATLTVAVAAELNAQAEKTVILSLSPDSGYNIGAPDSATLVLRHEPKQRHSAL